MKDLDQLAAEMARLQDTATLAEPITSRHPSFDIDDAYRVSSRLLYLRQTSGWHVVGRKIGFTNRTIYEEYGVYQPIFGYMYDRTVSYLEMANATNIVSLTGLSQRRIEPEIVFKLEASPARSGS